MLVATAPQCRDSLLVGGVLTHMLTMHQAARKENLTAVKFVPRMDLGSDGRHNR
ncbi:hypothetical protein I545_0789 [Mycobacterium kansasii 662]|uniref:Uncharacterized protein n=1 Tax=Mycobacterium kansasii 662 TaxID=1299326 RepID=X7ZSS6_MYCKA|nr:hypothetical protein I545_0789 [Mycobacterium kansasii 662]KEP43322.1 hypothetical protein MKSMC1_17090 [Mycobacterium kansasii]